MQMVGGIGNIGKIPELRKRITFTIILLGLYRIFIFIPVPGVNAKAMHSLISGSSSPATASQATDEDGNPIGPAPSSSSAPGGGGTGTLFGMYDMFSGGALQQF